MNVLDPLAWSVLLLIVGCALVVLEVFIPSGGILGFLAASSMLAAVVLAFYHQGPAAGLAFLATAVFAMPLLVAVALKYWPRTAIGKKFLLGLPTSEEVLPDDDRHRALKALVGQWGIAKCPMLPSGAVLIDGKSIDAISQGMPIEAGQRVVVIEVKANRVVVRPVAEGERIEQEGPDDILSRPIDSLGLDALDEPLA